MARGNDLLVKVCTTPSVRIIKTYVPISTTERRLDARCFLVRTILRTTIMSTGFSYIYTNGRDGDNFDGFSRVTLAIYGVQQLFTVHIVTNDFF
jgi:hypothetical protein